MRDEPKEVLRKRLAWRAEMFMVHVNGSIVRSSIRELIKNMLARRALIIYLRFNCTILINDITELQFIISSASFRQSNSI